MEQHGVHMAETLFYDVHPERDPEGLLKKFVTIANFLANLFASFCEGVTTANFPLCFTK